MVTIVGGWPISRQIFPGVSGRGDEQRGLETWHSSVGCALVLQFELAWGEGPACAVVSLPGRCLDLSTREGPLFGFGTWVVSAVEATI